MKPGEADYSLLVYEELRPGEVGTRHWDVFVSAYNASYRVQEVFDQVSAKNKIWLIHPEYMFDSSEYPSGELFVTEDKDEADFWGSFFKRFPLGKSDDICFDMTGMMRPHLILLPKLLKLAGFSRVTLLYSDPTSYESGSKTRFAQGAVTEVRQVRGYEGTHIAAPAEQDLLIIGAGYDAELIRRAAEDKPAARKMQMFGLPSLQAHMYQQGQYRAAAAAESVSPLASASTIFAPANNPFETAHVLQKEIGRARDRGEIANLYMSPLATKAQVLGFALYYLVEEVGQATSMIFPIAPAYTRETSIGLSRVTLSVLELDWLA